jgi:hypothetical protein
MKPSDNIYRIVRFGRHEDGLPEGIANAPRGRDLELVPFGHEHQGIGAVGRRGMHFPLG